MLILGIETSCDETSASVIRDGRQVLANIVASQVELHAPFGGVVPEIASRRHVQVITQVVREALITSGVTMGELDAVAATRGPGLAGSLLVGFNFARALAFGLDKPLVPVNHLEGHLHSVWLTEGQAPALPLLALIVSGGHTELVLMRDHGRYEVLGRTLDDAAGEAFDKVARLLGLSYPGGPSIERAAQQAENPEQLPRAWLPGTYDFSFSGLKTATLHLVRERSGGMTAHQQKGGGFPRLDGSGHLGSEIVANIAAGFQESVVDVLVRKTQAAAEAYNPSSVAVVGGVAANRLLGDRMRQAVDRPLYIAPLSLSTDNAAMIAGAAFYVARDDEADVAPSLALA